MALRPNGAIEKLPDDALTATTRFARRRSLPREVRALFSVTGYRMTAEFDAKSEIATSTSAPTSLPAETKEKGMICIDCRYDLVHDPIELRESFLDCAGKSD